MEGLLQHVSDRIKGRVLKEGGSRAFEPGMPLGNDPVAKLLHQARLADPGFANDSDYLAFALDHTFPTALQQA